MADEYQTGKRAAIATLIGVEFVTLGAVASSVYMQAFMSERGLSDVGIGIVLSIKSFIIIFMQPFWGIMGDKFRSVKKVLSLLLIISSALIMLLPLDVSLGGTIAIFIGFAMFGYCVTPTMDALMSYSLSTHRDLNYGHIRLFGSLGYGVVAMFYRYVLVPQWGVEATFYAYLPLALASILLMLKLKDPPAGTRLKFKDMHVSKLLKNYGFIICVVFAAICNIPSIILLSFLHDICAMIDIPVANVALLAACKAFMEIPAFIISAWLIKRFGAKAIMLCAAALMGIEFLLFMQATELWHVILLLIIHGSAFSLFTSSMIINVFSYAPDGLKSTAQMVYSSVASGVASVLAGQIGGQVIHNFGMPVFFAAGAGIEFGAIALYFCLSRLGKHKLINKEQPIQ